ncbi:ROK family transcriptional regulator [Mesorhizobium sp.]|uniref:ROK family transcriptional regulator n=1 Tax=Mesorhizobium sp. TaxID=1871066 RepID=UPI0025BE8CC5|nr:ROK family transcriptional regulator [Mesorhizobium sp.]
MKTTNLIRHVNETRCLRLLRRASPLSRADIARELGLTRATAGNVIAVLLEADLAIELNEPLEAGKVGRPGIRVALNPKGAFFVGIDVSSTWLAGVLVDFSGAVLNKITIPNSKNFREPEPVAQAIADLARRLVVGAGVDTRRVRGVGVSVPGIVGRDGVVVSAKLLEWQDVDIGQLVASSLGAPWPIRVCNDAVALSAAIGALDTHETEDMLVVLLSEGIGAAIIRNGRVAEGASGFAGEIGHMVLSASPEDAKSLTLGLLGGYGPFLPLLPSGQSIAEGLASLAAMRSPSGPLEAVLDRWARVISVGLLNLIHVLNPARIVLGGPLAVLFNRIEARVDTVLRANLLHGLVLPPIEVAGVEADTVAVGAAGTLRDSIFLLPELDQIGNGLPVGRSVRFAEIEESYSGR